MSIYEEIVFNEDIYQAFSIEFKVETRIKSGFK